MGTAEAQILINDAPVFDDDFRAGGYQQGVLAVGTPRYYLCCGLSTSGGAVEWFRAQTGGAGYDALIAAAWAVPPGSNGVCFLPQLRGGDQPHPSPNARAGFIGIAGDSSQAILFRSVLEGLAMSARLAVEGMTARRSVAPIKRIRVIGGSTRNDLWMKIKASVYGRAIEVTPLNEGTCLSVAMLGGIGLRHLRHGCGSARSICRGTRRGADRRAGRSLDGALRPALSRRLFASCSGSVAHPRCAHRLPQS